MAGTTTNYGWTYPTSTDLVKDGATAIQTAIQGADTSLFTALGGNYPGMRLVKKQTIGSAVSSVTVSGAFSATYENYRILITGGVGSVNNGILRLQLGSVATGYYSNMIYANYASGSVASTGNNNGTSFTYAGVSDTINITAMIDVNSPFLAKQKQITGVWYDGTNSGRSQGQCSDQTSQTAFTILTTSGTLTGGTIYVYGYGIS